MALVSDSIASDQFDNEMLSYNLSCISSIEIVRSSLKSWLIETDTTDSERKCSAIDVGDGNDRYNFHH